jgi:hypothetical protein
MDRQACGNNPRKPGFEYWRTTDFLKEYHAKELEGIAWIDS